MPQSETITKNYVTYPPEALHREGLPALTAQELKDTVANYVRRHHGFLGEDNVEATVDEIDDEDGGLVLFLTVIVKGNERTLRKRVVAIANDFSKFLKDMHYILPSVHRIIETD